MTGQSEDDYSLRQAAYDLRKLRGKDLVAKPGRSHRYRVPLQAARTITALLTLREQVIAPILTGVRSPRRGRKPAHWSTIDRDYESLRSRVPEHDRQRHRARLLPVVGRRWSDLEPARRRHRGDRARAQPVRPGYQRRP